MYNLAFILLSELHDQGPEQLASYLGGWGVDYDVATYSVIALN